MKPLEMPQKIFVGLLTLILGFTHTVSATHAAETTLQMAAIQSSEQELVRWMDQNMNTEADAGELKLNQLEKRAQVLKSKIKKQVNKMSDQEVAKTGMTREQLITESSNRIDALIPALNKEIKENGGKKKFLAKLKARWKAMYPIQRAQSIHSAIMVLSLLLFSVSFLAGWPVVAFAICIVLVPGTVLFCLIDRKNSLFGEAACP